MTRDVCAETGPWLGIGPNVSRIPVLNDKIAKLIYVKVSCVRNIFYYFLIFFDFPKMCT